MPIWPPGRAKALISSLSKTSISQSMSAYGAGSSRMMALATQVTYARSPAAALMGVWLRIFWNSASPWLSISLSLASGRAQPETSSASVPAATHGRIPEADNMRITRGGLYGPPRPAPHGPGAGTNAEQQRGRRLPGREHQGYRRSR